MECLVCLVGNNDDRYCRECHKPICLDCCQRYHLTAPLDYFDKYRESISRTNPASAFGWFHWDCLPSLL